jgi:hypothetical protein
MRSYASTKPLGIPQRLQHQPQRKFCLGDDISIEFDSIPVDIDVGIPTIEAAASDWAAATATWALQCHLHRRSAAHNTLHTIRTILHAIPRS